MKRLFSLFILLILVGLVKVSADNATTVKDSLLKVLNSQPKGESRLNSRPLKSILLSDIQQYNYQTSIVNLQVFVSLGIETCRFL